MKNKILFLLLIAFAATNCQDKKQVELRFCADVRPHEICIGEDSVFMQGRNVWAQLLLSDGFAEKTVTGNLYGFEDGKRVFIGATEHNIDEGQIIIMESMFFNSKGKFEVEFIDSKGNLLDKKGLEIW
jgi:hypothetical protein